MNDLLLQLYTTSSIIHGICPFNAVYEYIHKKSILSQVFNFVIVLVLIFCVAFAGVTKLKNEQIKYTVMEYILSLSEIFVVICMFISICYTNFFSTLSWVNFFGCLKKFDDCFDRTSALKIAPVTRVIIKKINKNRTSLQHVLFFLVTNSTVIILSITDNLVWSDTHDFSFSAYIRYFPLHIGLQYELTLTLFLERQSHSILERYQKLQTLIQILVNDGDEFKLKIRQIKNLYRLLHDSISNLSNALGLTLLFVFAEVVIGFLIDFFYCCYLSESSFYSVVEETVIYESVILVSMNNINKVSLERL